MNRAKARYRTDLVSLHTLCETNYARLLRLFPNYETCNERHLAVGNTHISISVTERSRFTTFFTLSQLSGNQWLGSMRTSLRCYHDARMVEVVRFQSHKPVSARYHYPNDDMHQPDEKYQQNQFLTDWLNWCLEHGLNSLPATVEQAAS